MSPRVLNPSTHFSASLPPDGGWLCYIVCCADNTLYTGVTSNLAKRLAAHNAGTAAKYTRARGPVELVFAESCADQSAALKREMQIKRLPRAQKLALIKRREADLSCLPQDKARDQSSPAHFPKHSKMRQLV